ncbi:MAG TPA: hypothetical protein RMH80_32945, partial [Polyangiaceae bacterium LLY-WYZ-15_(1-7)]|nr:hypothetical protein [Polyangiaceae bacterium LLY-WYZ-15_(1-7)]
MGPRPDRPALLRAQLRRRRRVLAVAGAVLLAGVLWRWDGYADAGDAEASLAAFLHDQVEVDAESVLWWGETGALTYRPALFRGRVDPSQPHDLYFVRARLTDDGGVLGVRGLSNLTRTSSADEQAPRRLGPHHAAYATRVRGAWGALTVLDLRGEPEAVTEGWPSRARAQNAVTNLQETGRPEGFGRRRYALRPPAESLELDDEEGRLVAVADGARVVIDPGALSPVEGAERVEAQAQEKGVPGTITWVVDTVRNLSFVGPEPIAWLESRVFAVKDWVQRQYYAIAGAPDTEQEVAEELGVELTEEETRRRAELAVTDPELGWPPAPAEPFVRSPARGEGEWIPVVDDPWVRENPNAPPAFFTTFLQVDPERPFTRVYVALWDPRQAQLRIMSGTREPESATGETAPGMVPRDPETLGRVVAGFNGGFQSLHGEFGMMSEGRVYLPPKPWAATVAVMRDGRVGMGSWLDPPEGVRHYTERWAVDQIPEDMVEFRQNLTSVVEGDAWNPWRRWYWGAAPQGDEEQVYIDRSGLCLTEEGFLAYFWGKSMGAEELGRAMLAVRCVRGLHLDMNQRHTGFEFYHAFRPDGAETPTVRDDPPPEPETRRQAMHFEIGVPYARGWRVRGRKLARNMTPMRFPRYIRRDPRDFFYLTLKPVLPGRHLVVEDGAEGEGVFDTHGLPHAGWPHAFARTWLGAPPSEGEGEPEGERTWLVRIDPTRAVPAPLAGEALASDEGEAPAPLAYLGGSADRVRGAVSLWAERRLVGGWRFGVGAEVPEEAQVVLAGDALARGSDAGAAIGVDDDGFLVYAERSAPGRDLAADLALAGVRAALVLPDDARLAFRAGETLAGPD